jgi:hypothetical protein
VRGLCSASAVFLSILVLSSHALGNRGEWLLARIWEFLRETIVKVGATLVGDSAATILFTPLYALLALILLLSLAYRSPNGFVIVLCLVAINGLIPLNPYLLIGYIFWFSGFWLIQDDVLYLPSRVQERICLTKDEKDMLLELRNGPLDVARALFVLTGGKSTQLSSLSAEQQYRMRLLAGTGLIEVDSRAQMFYPSESLQDSYLARGVHELIGYLGVAASLLVLIPCGLYLISPIDLLPDPILPPLGFIDDIVLSVLASLPLIANGRHQLREALLAIRTSRQGRRDKEIALRATRQEQDAREILPE